MIGLGLSYKNSELSLDCKKWQSPHLCQICSPMYHAIKQNRCDVHWSGPGPPNLFSVTGHFHMRKFIAGHKRFCDV